MEEMIGEKQSARIDYISVVDRVHLKALKVMAGEILIALAVYIGTTRMIDNSIVKV